jgi:hypothetical protein
VLSSEVGRRVSHCRVWESEEISATFSFTADKIQNFDSFTCVASWFATWVWHEMWGKTLSAISIYKDFLFFLQKLFFDERLIWEFLVCTIEFPQQGHWYHFKWTSIQKKEEFRENGVVPNHNVAKSVCFQIWMSNVGLFCACLGSCMHSINEVILREIVWLLWTKVWRYHCYGLFQDKSYYLPKKAEENRRNYIL